MKIFLTGATGFIGSHFINEAHADGHVIIAQRRSQLSRPRIPLNKEPQWVEFELKDISKSELEGVDCLVHFAASGISPQVGDWSECFKTNVTETLDLCVNAIDAGVSRILISGTYAEYGSAGYRYDRIPVDAPLEPSGAYASSKAAAYLALQALVKDSSASLLYGRLFSVFGEGQFDENFWPSLRKSALAGNDFNMTEGEQIRDFVAVSDVAKYFVNGLVREDLSEGKSIVENVASGNPVSLRDFAEFWWNAFGAEGKLNLGAVPYRPNEVMRYVPEL